MDLTLKTSTFGGETKFLDSAHVRYVRGGVTLDAAQVAADGNGLKKLAAGTFIGKQGNGKWAKYVAAVASSLAIDCANDNADFVVTAKSAGAAGDDLKFELRDTDVNGQTLDVVVEDDTIVVKLAKGAGTASSLAIDCNNANADFVVTAKQTGVAGDDIKVELRDPAGNDQPLLVALESDTIVVNLATGGAGAITSTAQEVVDAINAALYVKDLVVASLAQGHDGTGVVEAKAAANLAGGADGNITSTANAVIAALAAHLVTKDLVTAETADGHDGTGVVEAKVAANLANGADANVTPTLILADDVVFTSFTKSGGAAHSDQVATACDHARVIAARLPAAPDDTVKANLPGVMFV